MSKILFLRVGIDSGCGGTLGPIFPDGSFEYVPIPEDPQRISPRSVYFRDLPARKGGTLVQYVPSRYSGAAAHYDPEFETYTYGDPGRNKSAQLLRLAKGDMLVFYAGLRPIEFQGDRRLYIIGYFTLESVETVQITDAWPPQNSLRFLGNAHLRRNQPDQGLVVACGNSRNSQLLHKAIVISDGAQNSTPEFERRTGIRGSLKRAVGRWVASESIINVINWITKQA
jgi:hypothetical protein